MKLQLFGYTTLTLWAIVPNTVSAKKIRGQTRRFLEPKASKANKAKEELYLTCGIKGAKCIPDGYICYEELPESVKLSDSIDVCGSCCSDVFVGNGSQKVCGDGLPNGVKCYEALGGDDFCDFCRNDPVEIDAEHPKGYYDDIDGDKYCGGLPDGFECYQEEGWGGSKAEFDVCGLCLNTAAQETTSLHDRKYCGGIPDGVECSWTGSYSEDVPDDNCDSCLNGVIFTPEFNPSGDYSNDYDKTFCGGLPTGYTCLHASFEQSKDAPGITVIDANYCDKCVVPTNILLPDRDSWGGHYFRGRCN